MAMAVSFPIPTEEQFNRRHIQSIDRLADLNTHIPFNRRHIKSTNRTTGTVFELEVVQDDLNTTVLDLEDVAEQFNTTTKTLLHQVDTLQERNREYQILNVGLSQNVDVQPFV